MEGSIGEPLLNADGKPLGGLACDSVGLSRGSFIEPSKPQTVTLLSACRLDYVLPTKARGLHVFYLRTVL
jgi:hypothetical protein